MCRSFGRLRGSCIHHYTPMCCVTNIFMLRTCSLVDVGQAICFLSPFTVSSYMTFGDHGGSVNHSIWKSGLKMVLVHFLHSSQSRNSNSTIYILLTLIIYVEHSFMWYIILIHLGIIILVLYMNGWYHVMSILLTMQAFIKRRISG